MRIIHKLKARIKNGKSPGQSFVELVLILPLILIMLAGMVEVAFGMFAYLTALDLTREAARFASVRDYRQLNVDNPGGLPQSACTDSVLHYFYDTACFFVDDNLNPFLPFDPNKFDDVTISVFTVTDNVVTHRHPTSSGGVWSLYSDNWKKDCAGNVVNNQPTFTNADIESDFVANAPDDRGIVLVEAYVCYDLILNFPLISTFIPSPFRIHAYTLMPAVEAIPTPTPIP